MVASMTPGGPDAAWVCLRRRSARLPLYPVEPLTVPGSCAVCRGPAGVSFARCYQCSRHEQAGRGLLADAVVPISYAVKGTALAADLWQYKSRLEPNPAARSSLLALLLVFLRDHGACVWSQAGMAGPDRLAGPAGPDWQAGPDRRKRRPGPDRLAVVPAGSGRPGPHPLLGLVSPYLRLPLARLDIRPGTQGRELNVNRYRADRSADGGRVLLLDDSWVTGASAQSAAAALRLAGARQVAIVVLGRHVDPADPRTGPWAARLSPAQYEMSACAVHKRK